MSGRLPGRYLWLSEKVISLIVDALHDQAKSTIEEVKNQISEDEYWRLSELVRIDRDKPEGIAKIDDGHRRAYRKNGTWTAYVYTLGVELMDLERWLDAEVVLNEVIALSKAKDELFFLEDTLLRRALCLKYLGRRHEMEALKKEIPAEAGVFICRQDLGGCIRLTRDHIV